MKPARHKALTSLATLQKRSSTIARTQLARCLAEEKRIEAQIIELKTQMQENRILVSAAREEQAQDLTLWNGYRYWLPVAQEELERLEQKRAEAEQRSDSVRQTVMESVRQHEATSGLLRKDREARMQQRQRQEQAVLDERAQYCVMAEM